VTEGRALTDELNLPAEVALLWGLRETPRRGPKSTLTVEDITRAAVEVADAEGLAAVSMARVAAQLGNATMALYRHVRSKDELLLLMTDAILDEPPDFAGVDGWRDRLSLWTTSVLAVLRRHPWYRQIPLNGPPVGPGNLAWFDRALTALEDCGLDDGEKIAVVMGLLAIVHGEIRLSMDLAAGYTVNPDAFSEYGRALASVVDPRRFPALAKIVSAGVFEPSADVTADIEADFNFALMIYLDGVAAYIARRGS
jgi:AcrR family transcriptional regulator